MIIAGKIIDRKQGNKKSQKQKNDKKIHIIQKPEKKFLLKA